MKRKLHTKPYSLLVAALFSVAACTGEVDKKEWSALGIEIDQQLSKISGEVAIMDFELILNKRIQCAKAKLFKDLQPTNNNQQREMSKFSLELLSQIVREHVNLCAMFELAEKEVIRQ